MITTEEAKELDMVTRELMLATEELSIVRATGYVTPGFSEKRRGEALEKYNEFVSKITNHDD